MVGSSEFLWKEAEMKVTQYQKEAELRRALRSASAAKPWRGKLAMSLRRLAARLEPTTDSAQSYFPPLS